MKKKVFLLCGAGALFGVALSTIITILISLTVGDGHFYAVVPELIADCGGELNAVMLQTALSMLYGAAWAGAALIWRRDGWSLTKQTALAPARLFPRHLPHRLGLPLDAPRRGGGGAVLRRFLRHLRADLAGAIPRHPQAAAEGKPRAGGPGRTGVKKARTASGPSARFFISVSSSRR